MLSLSRRTRTQRKVRQQTRKRQKKDDGDNVNCVRLSKVGGKESDEYEETKQVTKIEM